MCHRLLFEGIEKDEDEDCEEDGDSVIVSDCFESSNFSDFACDFAAQRMVIVARVSSRSVGEILSASAGLKLKMEAQKIDRLRWRQACTRLEQEERELRQWTLGDMLLSGLGRVLGDSCSCICTARPASQNGGKTKPNRRHWSSDHSNAGVGPLNARQE